MERKDHIHMLVNLHRRASVAGLIEEVKSSSSGWIKTKGPGYKNFYWQSGYGAFSIGQSGVVGLRGYIDRQKEHHLETTFQDEFRKFLKRYEIPYDERFVWD